MNYDLILIRYGELALKSPYVRRQFETNLLRNIKNAFKSHNLECTIQKERGRIYLSTSKISQATTLLQKIFGITSISPALQTTADISSISKHAVTIAQQTIKKGDSFALRVTRTGNHEYTSQDVAIKIGDDIRKATKTQVDLTKPDFELFIEIKNDDAYLFLEKFQGPGGLPLGTQGPALAVIDSPQSILATWYLMRRGCSIIFVTINERTTQMVQSFFKQWNADPDVVPIKREKNLDETLNTLAMEKHCDAIVTGHSLSTQSDLSDITRLKKYINIPVLSPLIGLEEKEIQQKCKEVGVPL